MRQDTDLPQIIQMVMGISRITTTDPEAIRHILDVALDGLRFRPADGNS